MCQRGDREHAAEASLAVHLCSSAGRDPSVQRAAALHELAGLGILWGAVLCCAVLWMALGIPGCQGGSQSPLTFQAACCRGPTSSASPSSTRPPQNTSHLSTGAGQSAILSLPVLQTPHFMFIYGDRSVNSRGQRQDSASLISEAGQGSFVPSRLKRQMGTCSSDLNWADWEVQLLPSAH